MTDACGEKACSQCGEAKPVGAFAVRRASKDGRSAYCRACAKAKYATKEKKADRRRRAGVPTRADIAAEAAAKREAKALSRTAAAAERAIRAAQPKPGTQEWYAAVTPEAAAAHRRLVAERARTRYHAEPLKKRAMNKRWKAANTDRVARHMADRAAREEANADGSITKPARAKLLASASHCGYCGDRLDPRQTHVDHRIPLAKGGAHRIENLVVCCSTCNLSKGDRTPWEWAAAGLPLAA